jgi:myo-inositol-1(or 4)-monophosphatase
MSGDIDLAARAVRAGAGAALAVVRGGGLDVRAKESPADLVSAADTAAEAAIAEVVRAERPGDALLGEEGATATSEGARRWLIDGIDGTFNFVSGIPHWCVAVGLEEDGEPAAAAVYDPSADELFVAGPGHPTTLNGAPVTVRTGRTLEQAAVATYLPPTAADAAATLGRLAEPVGVLRTGGAGTLELAWVAAGRVDGWAQPDVAPWDWFPGAALVCHAGGTTTVLDGEPTWHLAGAPALVADLAAVVPRA